MSDEFYQELAEDAHELLDEFGAQVEVKHIAASTYDPATGRAAPTEQTYQGVGAKFDYAEYFIDGTKIKRGDQRLLISAVGMPALATGDMLVFMGVKYSVVNAQPLAPAGITVLHDVHARGVA